MIWTKHSVSLMEFVHIYVAYTDNYNLKNLFMFYFFNGIDRCKHISVKQLLIVSIYVIHAFVR